MNEPHDNEIAMLASERGDLIDQVAARVLSELYSTEDEARAVAVEIIDLGTVLLADFAGTPEFERAKSLVDARIKTKLATLAVRAQGRGRTMVREFAMGLLLGARTILVGRIAP
jgi:hypothetical protein